MDGRVNISRGCERQKPELVVSEPRLVNGSRVWTEAFTNAVSAGHTAYPDYRIYRQILVGDARRPLETLEPAREWVFGDRGKCASVLECASCKKNRKIWR